MSNEELFNLLVKRSDEEHDKFVNSIDNMYNKMKDTIGYEEKLFFIMLTDCYRQAGIEPQIATLLLKFARNHVNELLAKEANNG